MVSVEDVETLAMAAGGYGVPTAKHTGFSLGATATQ
jgi:hypothetical protein